MIKMKEGHIAPQIEEDDRRTGNFANNYKGLGIRVKVEEMEQGERCAYFVKL